jgi:hypothetical protein
VLTRGDCSVTINQTVCFLNNPDPTHIVVVKRILRYIVGTGNLGLTYRKSSDEQEVNKLNVSSDADHVGDDDRRSVSGWCVMLNGAMIFLSSNRQPVTGCGRVHCAPVCVSNDNRSKISDTSSLCYSFTHEHRSIGYHNTPHPLDDSVTRLRYLCVCDNRGSPSKSVSSLSLIYIRVVIYDNRVISSKPTPSPLSQ